MAVFKPTTIMFDIHDASTYGGELIFIPGEITLHGEYVMGDRFLKNTLDVHISLTEEERKLIDAVVKAASDRHLQQLVAELGRPLEG